MRQLKGPVKKESRKEKRAAKKEWAENRSSVVNVVLPTVIGIGLIIILIIIYGTRSNAVEDGSDGDL